MDTTSALLYQIRLLFPIVGVCAFLAAFSLVVLVLFPVLVLSMGKLREAAKSSSLRGNDPTGGGGSAGGNTLFHVVQASLPGLGRLAGSFKVVVSSVGDLITSLGTFISNELVQFLIAVLFAAAAAGIIIWGTIGLLEWFILVQCHILPVWNFVMRIVNLGAFLLGIWWPVITFSFSIAWAAAGVLYRVLISCTLAEADTILTDVINTLAAAIGEFFTALYNFLSADETTLREGRIDFIPFFAEIGTLTSVGSIVLDCACEYLSFLWTDLLELPQSVSLHVALDCALNTPVRLVQMGVRAITNGESLDFHDLTTELQCVALSSGDFGEDALLVVLNMLSGLVDLLPVSLSISPEAPTTFSILRLPQ